MMAAAGNIFREKASIFIRIEKIFPYGNIIHKIFHNLYNYSRSGIILSLARCFGLLKEKSISPAADQKTLLSWGVFNFLVGNADAHGKNLAVIFTPKGPRLAPFYDLICTRVYPGLTDRLAMRIGGENRPEWIQPRHWEGFSSEISIKFRLPLRTLKEMARKITSNAGVLVRDFSNEFGNSNVVGNILEVIKRESNRIAGWPDHP